MRWFVTGTAGFIGYHLARRLLQEGHEVVGFDAFTDYYDVSLKEDRHAGLTQFPAYEGHRGLLQDRAALEAAWGDRRFDRVAHLAAQAGVRHSLSHPGAYVDSNVVGTFNVLDLARQRGADHVMLASTSSIYGANEKIPFAETDMADRPLTIYAATKKATELMAHSIAHAWQVPVTAFRFFTVYGPWGRPDMAPMKFTKAALSGGAIDVYNHGDMKRDFTFIDDLVEAILRLSDVIPVAGAGIGPEDSLSPVAPFRVVNIGGGQPVGLMDFIEAIETAAGRKATRNYLPMQPGDFKESHASAALLEQLTGYKPATRVRDGVARLVEWYRGYYG